MVVQDDQIAQGNQTYTISLGNPVTTSCRVRQRSPPDPSRRRSSTIERTWLPIERQNSPRSSTGFEQYRAIYGRFPVDDVASLFDANGNPYLSWRVYILPFIGYTSLFQQFDLTAPWNSPQNLPLLNQMPDVFRSRGLGPGRT